LKIIRSPSCCPCCGGINSVPGFTHRSCLVLNLTNLENNSFHLLMVSSLIFLLSFNKSHGISLIIYKMTLKTISTFTYCVSFLTEMQYLKHFTLDWGSDDTLLITSFKVNRENLLFCNLILRSYLLMLCRP